MEILKDLLLTFIPIFVAVDAIGTVPIFIGFTAKLDKSSIQNVTKKSILIAFVLCILFIFIGKTILNFLNITIPDFKIAGGILLFIISIKTLVENKEGDYTANEGFSVVPLATPLITGPALLTTLLILVDNFSIIIVIISTALNLILTGILLLNATYLIKIFGKNGINALAKVSSLFLAAIAVMLVRIGVESVILNMTKSIF